jgi:hypothetical protein
MGWMMAIGAYAAVNGGRRLRATSPCQLSVDRAHGANGIASKATFAACSSD